jgi:hypothetical protein
MTVTDAMIDAFLDYWSKPGWRKFSGRTQREFRRRAREALEIALAAATH